jgi:uncharacterized protein (DUF2342 family)
MNTVPRLDWPAAARVGGRVVPAGPKVEPAQARAAVEELRDAAEHAADIVADRSGLLGGDRAPVLVVDRPGWIRANTELAESLLAQVAPASQRPTLFGRVAGAQAGLVLAVVSTRILGQFDGLTGTPRLLLVAPNVVEFERTAGLPPRDFRLWVCLHEQTHQFQFAHAPWLGHHIRALLTDFLDRDETGSFDRIVAAMTLLEGHAEVQMDVCAAGRIGSVARLRRALDARRRATGPLGLVQRVMGMNLKVTQYEQGGSFCRYLYDRGGSSLLNLPLSGADRLPSVGEIADPERWLRRVGA